ncbi:GTPase domain-containing protein [Xylanimonas ulmi]|uniref:50S ribosome-binding GTPase n=1 Tax=Xylanimonas ulmi TaxID=228973 RepID=A0A4Q7M3W0_9MICO|nr:GTPase domain-containing protein [Xylanibacterium ulmi]RZS62234.1 50S ribosome-binding GTPase [Xylanibacterium ulmi]
MTGIHVHDLAVAAPTLLGQFRDVVSAAPEASAGEAARILTRAVLKPRETTKLVLTGQFSAGKSKLIAALTDGVHAPKDSPDRETDTVSEYPWDDVVTLVDTPGVQAGVKEHDERASDGVSGSDLILFVVPPEMLDDAAAEYLRFLAIDRAQYAQMIVVMTKVNTVPRPPGGRARLVEQALGPVGFTLPFAEVDSVDYLRSREGGASADLRRQQSGIDELRRLINGLAYERGDLARLRQPLILVRTLCDEAMPLFADSGLDADALHVLADLRKAILERKGGITSAFEGAATRFRADCLTDVTAFVDRVTNYETQAEADRDLPEAEQACVAALDRHADTLAATVRSLIEQQMVILEQQLEEAGETAAAAALVDAATPFDARSGRLRIGAFGPRRSAQPSRPAFNWNQATDLLKKGKEWWVGGAQNVGGGLRGLKGSPGHEIVLKVGHFFDHKFKPWQALKIADKIGKAAGVAGFVIPIAVDTFAIVKEERAALDAQRASERLHARLVTEVMANADEIVSKARQQLWSAVDPVLDAILADIASARAEGLASQRDRMSGADALERIAGEADRLLAASASTPLV